MSEQPENTSGEASLAKQKKNLSQGVQREVVSGYRVESQTDTNAILVKGGNINHVLHLILTLVTLGAWSLVWLILWIANRESRLILTVDDYGNVLRQSA